MKKRNKRQNASMISDQGGFLSGAFQPASYGTVPLSQPYGLMVSNAYTPLTLNRILLSYAYLTHGIIQTMIDVPIEDGFRGGIIVKCDELDSDDLETLYQYLEDNRILEEVKNVMKYAKLYGGAGLIINTDQDPKTPLNTDAIGEKTPLSFISADRWELTLNYINVEKVECPYNYYGQVLHKTRVMKVMGKEAPSYIRRRLQGWGMSEIERIIRPINAYVKNEDLVYELLDEAKVDIWKILGFNSGILSKKAGAVLNERLNIATMVKNYHRAVVMDKEDDFDQKQISFGGLPEILHQNRLSIAAAVRMPLTKLFGISAAGFSSGEDDIENYNALVEGEVRSKAKTVLHEVVPLCIRQLFGFEPERLTIEFKPLRVLSAEQNENVKNHKHNRLSSMYSQGMLTGKEFADALKQEEVFSADTEVSEGLREPMPPETPSSGFDKPEQAVKAKEKEAV